MTMLTSLKALLFPTPAQTGVKGDAMPSEGSAGFAQLLNGMGTTPTPVGQSTAPAPFIRNGDGVFNNNVEYQHVIENSWHPAFAGTSLPAVSADSAPDVEAAHLAVQLAVALPDSEVAPAQAESAPAPIVSVTAQDGVEPSDPVPANDIHIPAGNAPVAVAAEVEAAMSLPEQPEGEVPAPSATAPVALADVPTAPVSVEPQFAPAKLHHARPHEAAPLDMSVPLQPAATPDDAPEVAETTSDEAKPAVPADGQPPMPSTVAVMAPPASSAAPATAPTETAEATATQVNVARSVPASRPATGPTPKAQPTSDAPAPSMPDMPVSPAPATLTRSPATSDYATSSPAKAVPPPSGATAPEANSIAPVAVEPVPTSAVQPVEQPAIGNASPDTGQAATAMPVAAANRAPATVPTPDVVAIPSVTVAATPSAETDTAAAIVTTAPAALAVAEVADQVPDPAQAATPVTPAKPRAEAVSLLQLVRDHMGVRAPRRAETASPAGDATLDTAPVSVPTVVNDSATPLPPLAQPVVQPLAPAAPAMPAVDLSASLGAQVVDMGVSGQWIDGLARDIASFSVNGAQGRFQINATELGPIQVDIRQGDDGAAISLTVATEAAEQALRQDSDRLKLDASLSAVRISEVKIERTPQPTETARSDSATSQNGGQQQSGGGSQNPGQAAGQNMGQSSAQSHMQGRGQQRENIAFGHKSGNDGAVLNHMDAGDTAGGAARARYA